MNFFEKCGEERGGGGGSCEKEMKSHQSSRFRKNILPINVNINYAKKCRNSISFFILMISSSLVVICMMNVNLILNARIMKPTTALSYEDLIEGKLDTNQLCGIRYLPSLGQRKQQFTNSDNNKNNYKFNFNHNGFGTTATKQTNEMNYFAAGANYHYKDVDDEGYEGDINRMKSMFYIVGGDEVEDDQFWPWSVAIYELDPLNGQKEFICSGSLISDKFILTAAHCIQQSRFDILTADEIFLKIASVRLDDDKVPFYNIEKVFVHPDYIASRKANDIALLKLKLNQRSLPPRARPICLPSNVANRIDFTDQQVTIIGWGKTSAMKGDEPTRLIEATTTESEQNDINNELDLDSTGGFETKHQSSSSSSSSLETKRLNDLMMMMVASNKKDSPLYSPLATKSRRTTTRRRKRAVSPSNAKLLSPSGGNNHHSSSSSHHISIDDNSYNSNHDSSSESGSGGSGSSSSSQTNDTLLQAEVRVTSTDECNRNYSKLEISWLNIDEHFLCASDPQGKRDACQGDSGGPLMWNTNSQQQLQLQLQPASSLESSSSSSSSLPSSFIKHHQQYQQQEKWYQLGLVSFGHGCANSQFPGVYTRISYYMPWILNIVNGRHENNNNNNNSNQSYNHNQKQAAN